MLAKRIVNYEKQDISTPAGTKFLNIYTPYTEDGREKLEKTGETNVYEKIQADLEESKVENIIKRVMMGDLSAIRTQEITYCDTSTMPKDMMEVQNTIVKMKAEFDKMPEIIKRQFNYSAEEYVNEMGSKEFIDKLEPYYLKMKRENMEKNDKEYRKKVAEKADFNYDLDVIARDATTNDKPKEVKE